MKTFAVEIVGSAPGLLMHKFDVEAEADVQAKVKKRARKDDTPEAQAERGAYRMEDGTLFQPAEHIYQALCRAASLFQVAGQGKKTYKDAIKGNVLVEPACIPHGATDYSIDSRRVRIQRGMAIRSRPHLPTWSLAFTLQLIDDDAVPGEVLNSILVAAGQSVGIGDYRPRFGRFIVTKFKAA
jgi:hypothetical protein